MLEKHMLVITMLLTYFGGGFISRGHKKLLLKGIIDRNHRLCHNLFSKSGYATLF